MDTTDAWHTPLRVLVVDDNTAVRTVLGAMLTRLGYIPILAGSGTEGMAAFRALQAEVTAVVLDVQMPGADGPAVLAAIRALDPELPCVFLSGDTGTYSEADLLARGAAAVLLKPVTLHQFGEALADAIRPVARAGLAS